MFLWNPSTLWEEEGEEVVNSSFRSLESAYHISATVISRILHRKRWMHWNDFRNIPPPPAKNIHSFTIHLLVSASFTVCRGSYPPSTASPGLFACSYPSCFWIMLLQLCRTRTDKFSQRLPRSPQTLMKDDLTISAQRSDDCTTPGNKVWKINLRAALSVPPSVRLSVKQLKGS